MHRRSTGILVIGVLLGSLVILTSERLRTGVLPTANAQPAEAPANSPPGIKPGVKVEYFPLDNTHKLLLGTDDTIFELPIVEEVKGHWVRLRIKPNEAGKNLDRKEFVYWVNFNNVLYYRL